MLNSQHSIAPEEICVLHKRESRVLPVLHPGGWPDGNFATPVRSECLFIVTSPLVDFCTRELYRLLAGLKILR